MNRLLQLLLLVLCFFACNDEEPGLACEDSCNSIIPFSMIGSYNAGQVVIDLNRDFSSPFLFEPTCSPVEIDLLFSIDGIDFTEIDPIPSSNNRIILDNITPDANYFFRLINYHCHLDPAGSKEMMISTNEFSPNEVFKQIDFVPTNRMEITNDGTQLAYIDFDGSLVCFDLQTNEISTKIQSYNAEYIKWSNDNQKIVFVSYSNNVGNKLQVYDLKTKETQVIYTYDFDTWIENLAWSNDDEKVYFLSSSYENQMNKLQLNEIFLQNLEHKNLSDLSFDNYGQAKLVVSPTDDDLIYFSLVEWSQNEDVQNIYSYSFSDNKINDVLAGDYKDEIKSISPDGKKMAIATTRSGQQEIWIYYLETKTFKRVINTSQTNSITYTDPLTWINDNEFVFIQSFGFNQTVILRKVIVD